MDEILLTLTDAELRTVIALRNLASRTGLVEATTEQIGTLTRYSPATLRRAFRALEERGFLTTVRTKRNLGKYSVNKYQLSPSLMGEQKPISPALTDERSTTGISSSNSHITITSHSKNDIGNSRKRYKEIKVVNRWKDDDDDLAGVGLFEDEKPAAVKHKLSTDARDPKTRGRRPQENWTPTDVAVEFSFQLSRKYPYLPGLVKTKELGGALAANRKKYGITPLIELEIMRLFMGDQRMHSDAEKAPQYLHGKFLRMFTTHMDQAMMNLGMPTRNAIANDVVDEERSVEYVYASDGREFDNSIVGRKALARYESKLNGVNHGA